MKEIYYKLHCPSVGDNLCATPTLRMLNEIYQTKINVVVNHKIIFENNPRVKNIYSFQEFANIKIPVDSEVLQSYMLPGERNQFGVERKFNRTDLRQVHANDLGFQLHPDEMSYEFFPSPFKLTIDLPESYVVLHITTNWPNRTWSDKNWQDLIDFLAENKIFTILVGKNNTEVGWHTIEKQINKYKNLYGLDLTNIGDLSDLWHILNMSRILISPDSGPLHLAATTDTHIVEIGGARDPRITMPYRHGTQTYKYTRVGGTCNIFCVSDMKYSIKEWGTINAVPPLIGCLENKPTFECQPTIDKVKTTIINLKNLLL